MIKRALAALLWAQAGWVGAAILAFALDLPTSFAPVAAFAVGAFVAYDPAHLFWAQPSGSPSH